MFGFKEVNFTDHQFAAYLKKQGALEHWQATSNANMWYAGGKCVAVAIYDNTACTRKTWIP